MQIEVFQSDLDGSGLRIGVVQARFNQVICEALRDACLAELVDLGVESDDVFVCTVPGALEIPVVLQQLASSGEFDALIALGAVVRGETYHFEVVSNESAAGIARVALDFNVPIAGPVAATPPERESPKRAPRRRGSRSRWPTSPRRCRPWGATMTTSSTTTGMAARTTRTTKVTTTGTSLRPGRAA